MDLLLATTDLYGYDGDDGNTCGAGDRQRLVMMARVVMMIVMVVVLLMVIAIDDACDSGDGLMIDSGAGD